MFLRTCIIIRNFQISMLPKVFIFMAICVMQIYYPKLKYQYSQTRRRGCPSRRGTAVPGSGWPRRRSKKISPSRMNCKFTYMY